MSAYEGEANYHVPAANKLLKTWYKVYGDLKSSTRTPLITLHGGPGLPHNYLLVCEQLASKYSIPVIFYDQLGCGRSVHLPEKNGDASFWKEKVLLDELDNLINHLGIEGNYDLLGHSWGGMLGARHATGQPKGLRRLVVCDSPASMVTWVKVANKLRKQLPQGVQDALTLHEEAGTTDSKEYHDAQQVFYDEYCCRLNPLPELFVESLNELKKDSTVYNTMNGPSEFFITGTIKDWTIEADLHKIKAPTLLINGEHDEAQDEVVLPYFNLIERVKWVKFANSSHTPHLEETDRFIEVVGTFLTQ